MNSCNGKPPATIPAEVAFPYLKDLNISNALLHVAVSMIPDLVKTHQQDPRVQLKHVTPIHVCDISSSICCRMPYYASILSQQLQRKEPFLFSGV